MSFGCWFFIFCWFCLVWRVYGHHWWLVSHVSLWICCATKGIFIFFLYSDRIGGEKKNFCLLYPIIRCNIAIYMSTMELTTNNNVFLVHNVFASTWLAIDYIRLSNRFHCILWFKSVTIGQWLYRVYYLLWKFNHIVADCVWVF